MSLASLLPAPKNAENYKKAEANIYAEEGVVAIRKDVTAFSSNPNAVECPGYGERQGFVPRDASDFGDGGAFPEIHVLQYPLEMGRKDKTTGAVTGAKTAALKVDSEGNVKYDMIIRQHMRKGFNVATSYLDLMEKDATEEELTKPDLDVQAKLAEKTRLALGQLVDAKIASAQPNNVKKAPKEPTYIRYTPSQQSAEHNSGSQQRIIRLQDMPTDPMEPPQFKHKKLPQGPPSPPVPIMHSPPKKITVQDQQNWKIPPCISNWKNIKGYTIPLDKRLAADGRGLEEVQVNDRFAALSESLFISERNARKEIEARNSMRSKYARKQKAAQEDELRTRAAQARRAGSKAAQLEERAAEDYDDVAASAAKETEEDVEALEARQDLRKDRQREMRRETRMNNMGDERKQKNQAARERERDVGEQIALGKAAPKSKDAMFDQRIFNQDEGMASNLGADDAYAVYSTSLFKGNSQNYIYRAKPGEAEMSEADVQDLIEKSTSRFKADKGFDGSEKSSAATTARDRPVEFEKDEADPYGVNDLLDSSSKKDRRRDDSDDDRESKRSRRR